MSKLDKNIINNIKMLGLDMISSAGSGDVGITLSSAEIFYTLFMNHLNFDYNNSNFINRDRVVVSNRLIPLMYATLKMFYKDLSIDNLKEYKKLNSITSGASNIKTPGIEIGSFTNGDVLASGVGIALGEKYLESLIKIEKPNCNLINFHTICICTEEDLMSGFSYESASFASTMNLNKLIYIVIKDGITKDSSIKETFTEDLKERFVSLKFNVEELNGNNLGALNDVLEEAYVSKKPSIIIVKNIYGVNSSRENSNKDYNLPLSSEELSSLRIKYNLNTPFEIKEEYLNEIIKNIDKRLNKKLSKWQNLKQELIGDLKVKEIIEFLETGTININFKPENIKINDSYEEDLLISNSKILNILTNKSPFILCGSNNNFVFTKASINKSEIMSKDNPTGRNILFGGRTISMGGIANGLASLGFKVFISAPLIDENILASQIKVSTMNNLNVCYIFTHDTFLNTYEDLGNSAINEINNLRMIPNLITLRPADINEIIGTYEIISNYKKPVAIVIGSGKLKKLIGTNPKYVVAGAYRVRRERENVNAIIIASGSEVNYAIEIVNELTPYGIDFRVVSMPSNNLYDIQNAKYKNILLPKDIKTFVLEFGSNDVLDKYATNESYVLGINKFSGAGTKEELLNFYDLNKDSIKAKIIELLKNN